MKPEAKKIELDKIFETCDESSGRRMMFCLSDHDYYEIKTLFDQLTQERDELKERLRPENDEAAHKLKTLKEGIEDAVQCESNHYWREELRRLLETLSK